VLTGQNGAGKTNLLEAVSLLSPGRGLRGARLDEIAMKGGGGTFAVAARIANSAGEVDLGTGVVSGPEGPESKRRVHVNHAAVGSSEALLDHLRVLWLTPAMDGLFTGPPADRRRYLDRAVLSIDKRHGTRANAFEKAMRGRNRLLAEPSPDASWLDAIETEMAELGVAIAAARREWAALAVAMIAAAGRRTPFPTAEVALSGSLEGDLDGRSPAQVDGEAPQPGDVDRFMQNALGFFSFKGSPRSVATAFSPFVEWHVVHISDPSAASGHPRGIRTALLGRTPTGWLATPGPTLEVREDHRESG
jgi:DNA replication and repair protein RecF